MSGTGLLVSVLLSSPLFFYSLVHVKSNFLISGWVICTLTWTYIMSILLTKFMISNGKCIHLFSNKNSFALNYHKFSQSLTGLNNCNNKSKALLCLKMHYPSIHPFFLECTPTAWRNGLTARCALFIRSSRPSVSLYYPPLSSSPATPGGYVLFIVYSLTLSGPALFCHHVRTLEEWGIFLYNEKNITLVLDVRKTGCETIFSKAWVVWIFIWVKNKNYRRGGFIEISIGGFHFNPPVLIGLSWLTRLESLQSLCTAQPINLT